MIGAQGSVAIYPPFADRECHHLYAECASACARQPIGAILPQVIAAAVAEDNGER